MMVTRPAKEVELCDLCEHERLLTTCYVCGRRYCAWCGGDWVGVYSPKSVCRDCVDHEDVEEICNEAKARIDPIIEARDAALRALAAGKRVGT